MIVEKMNDLPEKVAKVISVIFHPLFIPLYGMIIIFLPSAPYGYLPYGVKKLLLLIVAVNNVFLPLSLLPLLKQMNFISSLSLDDRKERKVPLLVTTILYATTTYMMFRFPVPFFLKSFIFSAFMISLVVTIVNFRWMISIHSAGAGGMIAFMLILCFRLYAGFAGLLALSIIAAGLILASRLVLNIHNPRQVWYGFFTGFTGTILFIFLFQKLA